MGRHGSAGSAGGPGFGAAAGGGHGVGGDEAEDGDGALLPQPVAAVLSLRSTHAPLLAPHNMRRCLHRAAACHSVVVIFNRHERIPWPFEQSPDVYCDITKARDCVVV